jgi:hypothetical protein
MSKEVREFAELYRIKLLNSSPYYAHANGQAESSNRTLINLIKKKISDNPKHWHKILSEALWAHRMMDNIDEVTDKRMIALGAIEKDKIMVARAYNKKVKAKSFQVGDLVWKTILPLRNKDRKFGKWSPSWEGPYKVKHVMSGNAYLLQTLQGKDLPKALNGRFLKQYHPSMWQDA